MIGAGEDLYEITTANFVSYSSMSGIQTTNIQNIIDLEEPVEPAALRKALRITLRRFKQWGMTVVLKDNCLYYSPAKGEIPVFEEGKTYELGTEQTGGHLFVITYDAKRIRIRGHHGLADGRGTFEFEKTLLYYYFLECGFDVDDEGMVVTAEMEADDAEDVDPFDAYADPDAEPMGIYAAQEAFQVPERQAWEKEPKCRRYEISLPMADLLKTAKKYGSSPVPVLSMYIAEAFREIYDTGDLPVTGYIPVDLRGYFGIKTYQNCAYYVPLPHYKRTAGMDMETQATVQRGILDLQAQKENFASRMVTMAASKKKLNTAPGSFAAKTAAVSRQTNANSREHFSYLLTYVGQIRMPEKMKHHIRDIKINIPAFTIPVTIAADEYNGILNITLTQDFEDDRFAKKLYEVLAKRVRNTAFHDAGIEEYDRLICEDIPVVSG